MKQIVYLNYIKIIAIIFVLIYHSEVTNDIYSSAFLSMCCPLFFVVNGYLMLRKEHSLAYLLRNNAKIFLLILLWGGICTCTYSYLQNELIHLLKVFQHIKGLDQRYSDHLWFFCTLFILNLLNPFIYKYIATGGNKCFFLSMLIICTLPIFRQFYPLLMPLGGWQSYSLLYYVAGFYMLSNNNLLNKMKISYILIIFLMAFALQLGYSVFQIDKHDFSPWYLVFFMYNSPAMVLMTLAFSMLLSKLTLPYNNIFDVIARNTLGIYVIHVPLLRIWNHYQPNNMDLFLVKPFVLLLVSTGVCWLMEQNKVTRQMIKF